MEQQIHSMPCVKSSTEHQLSRALLTLQWNMHQMVLLLWYIVQKLATGQQKISSRSTFRIPASHYTNRVYFLFSLCRVFTLIPNIIFTWRGIKVLIRIRKSQVKRALRRWSDPVFFFEKGSLYEIIQHAVQSHLETFSDGHSTMSLRKVVPVNRGSYLKKNFLLILKWTSFKHISLCSPSK